MGRVQLGKGQSKGKSPGSSRLMPSATSQRGVTLGRPQSGRRQINYKQGSGSKAKMVLLVAGCSLAAVIGIFLLLDPGHSSCQNTLRFSQYARDSIIEAPVSLNPDVSTSHCIKRVSYLLDGIKVGEREVFPFYLKLDDESLRAANIERRDKYRLTILVQDVDDKVKEQPESFWVVFDKSKSNGSEAKDSPASAAESPTEGPTRDRLQTLQGRSLQLASLITRRSGYVLGDRFLELVDAKLQDYAAAYEAAVPRIRGQWRQNINVSFSYFNPPTIAYVLALSRSGFDSKKRQSAEGLGLWQIPFETSHRAGLTETDFKSESSSAKVAADYTRDLLNAFDNDYILMIAYYGISIEQAGKRNAEISSLGLSEEERADIMGLFNRGVLKDEQLQNLANFFAAGVVCIAPRDFGANAPRLDELIQ